MMLYPSLSQLLEHVNSRYLLVNIIAHRAREISQEAENEDEPLDEKPVSMAISEIADGSIRVNFTDQEL